MDSIIVQALYPLLAIGIGIVMLMTQTAIKRDPQWALVISLITLAGSLWLAINNWPATPITATPLMLVDGYARLFTVVLTLAALVTVVIGRHWLMRNEGDQHEFFMLVLISTFGGVVLAHAQHFASFLLGLEILSVAIYTLIAYPDKSWVPIEAGLKYLVLSSASTAILLFGFALLYAATGALGFSELGERLANRNPLLIGTATLMIFSGLGFKLSLVPFHMWTPDVYQGAPTPVTGFLATVSKVAIFAGLLRWYDSTQLWQQPVLTDALAALAIASMLVGNFLALKQDDLKRLLGYSSIAHMGYLLVALVVLGGLPDTELAMEASVWYLVAYTASTLAAFAALSVWQTRSAAVTGSAREDATGMFWQEPLVALLMTIALLSLAGVPLTAGFIAKFYVVASGIEAGYWSLLSALVLGSAVSIFYYLRVIYAMSTQPDTGASGERVARSLVNLVFIGLLLAVLVLGIYPEPLIDIVRQTL